MHDQSFFKRPAMILGFFLVERVVNHMFKDICNTNYIKMLSLIITVSYFTHCLHLHPYIHVYICHAVHNWENPPTPFPNIFHLLL